jgi:hypothetical protein
MRAFPSCLKDSLIFLDCYSGASAVEFTVASTVSINDPAYLHQDIDVHMKHAQYHVFCKPLQLLEQHHAAQACDYTCWQMMPRSVCSVSCEGLCNVIITQGNREL